MKIVKTHHDDYLEIFSSQKSQKPLCSKRFCGWGLRRSNVTAMRFWRSVG